MKTKFFYILIFIFINTLNAKSEFFFLPKDANNAEEKIISLIKNAEEKIDIAMYNLSYKKFIKELKKASKKGIDVKIYLDKNKVKKSNIINKEFKNSSIKYKILSEKNHLKLALFDDKIAIFGSSNWTKSSFKDNFELLYLTTKKSDIKELKSLFRSLEKDY